MSDLDRSSSNHHPAAAILLRERARELARPREADGGQPAGREVLEFLVGGDAYALPVTVLREIQPVRKLTPLAGTPDFVQGIVVIRGVLVSVVDLRILLGLSRTVVTPESSAIILENDSMSFAVIADQVGEVRFLADEDLQAGEPSLEAVDRRYIAGVTRECVILLDGGKLLSDPSLVVNG